MNVTKRLIITESNNYEHEEDHYIKVEDSLTDKEVLERFLEVSYDDLKNLVRHDEDDYEYILDESYRIGDVKYTKFTSYLYEVEEIEVEFDLTREKKEK